MGVSDFGKTARKADAVFGDRYFQTIGRQPPDPDPCASRALIWPACDARHDDLLETVIPNLEHLPAMGRSFMDRPFRCVEASNAIDVRRGKLVKVDRNAEIREYALQHNLMLYAFNGEEMFLIAVRHHKQLSFDFKTL